jgi:hypothetical protein
MTVPGSATSYLIIAVIITHPSCIARRIVLRLQRRGSILGASQIESLICFDFTVSLDGKKLFDVEDSTSPGAGKTGLWTKSDSVIYFDDFEVARKE